MINAYTVSGAVQQEAVWRQCCLFTAEYPFLDIFFFCQRAVHSSHCSSVRSYCSQDKEALVCFPRSPLWYLWVTQAYLRPFFSSSDGIQVLVQPLSSVAVPAPPEKKKNPVSNLDQTAVTDPETGSSKRDNCFVSVHTPRPVTPHVNHSSRGRTLAV